MSSEATVAFPDVLKATGDVLVSSNHGPQTPIEPANQNQSEVESPKRGVAHKPIEVSDEFLMAQIQQGTKDSLSLLFQRYARAVRNVAYRILRNEAEADDLVQEVFLFIFRKAILFDATQGSARSWIIHVAYHRAFDRRRYLNTRHFYTSQNIHDVAANLADRRYEAEFKERSIEGIWGKQSAANLKALLSVDQLKTLEMHFFEGLTLEEIAERTGKSYSNVRNYYYRGLEKLRKPAFMKKLRSK